MTNQTLHSRVDQLERQLSAQRRNGLVILLGAALVATAAFQSKDTHARFTEVTVERLNVVEPDGQLVLRAIRGDRRSIANRAAARAPECGAPDEHSRTQKGRTLPIRLEAA